MIENADIYKKTNRYNPYAFRGVNMIRILMTALWGIEILSNIVLMISEIVINWIFVIPAALLVSFMLYLGFPALLLAYTHYSLHPITNLETFWDSIIVALSFAPWILGAYLGECWDEIIEADEEEDSGMNLPSMMWIGGIFVIIYIFRAFSLLYDAPHLSDWSQFISNYTVKAIEYVYSLLL